MNVTFRRRARTPRPFTGCRRHLERSPAASHTEEVTPMIARFTVADGNGAVMAARACHEWGRRRGSLTRRQRGSRGQQSVRGWSRTCRKRFWNGFATPAPSHTNLALRPPRFTIVPQVWCRRDRT